ncbi:DUF1592 domain-containing protein [Planctomyces sp. SH-PL14]|uniref:DUF1592 domain-containing protein n=1 Tax=Planctomyces sp. SH-PL14 TaxID=1632864 RepID=UPI00078CD8BE|nr:DUF1592 domain-containing protein [Planctomyces sp. SH-PL14]AMV20384.1 hypothetical protein VT03_20975 [Planctomyces sp. SH-PL14]
MRSAFRTLLLVCLAALGALPGSNRARAQDKTASLPPAWTADTRGYDTVVAPFFKTHCTKCHAGTKLEGNFSVAADRLPNNFTDPATRNRWREIVNVLNSHEMPPEDEKQPTPQQVAAVVDWITQQTVRAELVARENRAVLRRLNRNEYHNTIRDLIGIDFDVSGFPQDPPAGGFDNNGGALTVSPLHVEMTLAAAQQILDRALVEGDQPKSIRWRFEPRVGPADRTRKRLDERNNPLVNGGNNQQEEDWVVVHHNSWDKGVGARDFRVPTAGTYVIRLQAAGRVPKRDAVVAAAEKMLAHRRDEQDAKNPKGKRWTQEAYDNDLAHFRADRMYDYGPPRVKLNVQLGSQPRTIAEFDVDAPADAPKVYEYRTRMTTESAGIGFEYAYALPRVLENFWMQGHDSFARPELLLGWFEIEGPLYDAWPPTSHTAILFPSPKQKSNETEYAREVLTKFMRRAFRRPVAPSEVDAKLKLFAAARKEKAFVEAIKLPLVAVLTSPHFLYLVETPRIDKVASTAKAAAPTAESLSDVELASRLSYFLWSSMPDEELLSLAEKGQLKNPAVRRKQVDRMLADSRSDALVTNFAGQWLGLRDVGANPPAADLYPQYDRHLETSIVGESEAYFAEFLRHDLDVRQMIRSDFVTINERLARFYDIPDVRGDEFRRVAVPKGVERGGIVTQASILTTTSNGTRTSPVKRGTWILKTLLGTDPGLPVANAGEIAPKVPGIDKATVRKRLEIHRELPQCARCHNKIDPLGFALENFNAAGEWRSQEGFGYKGRVGRDDPVIDASSKMPDGEEIRGVAGLQAAMLKREDQFLGCLSSKLLTYACGRELGLADQPTVQAAVGNLKQNKYALGALIQFIVQSEPFTRK